MPTGADQPDILIDTSVAIALVVRDHAFHETTSAALRGRQLGLAGHAAFETFSVITRLPGPVRRTPAVAARLLRAAFPRSRFLSGAGAGTLLRELESLGIGGGAVYDGLVGAAAREHRLPLATRDRRALETYRVIGVRTELLS